LLKKKTDQRTLTIAPFCHILASPVIMGGNCAQRSGYEHD
jgi:hypothetical protein